MAEIFRYSGNSLCPFNYIWSKENWFDAIGRADNIDKSVSLPVEKEVSIRANLSTIWMGQRFWCMSSNEILTMRKNFCLFAASTKKGM